MKFGKEFAFQVVPEWQQAYMDYNHLKTLLKEIQHTRHRYRQAAKPAGLKRALTLYRAFSGLIQRQNHHTIPSVIDIENQAILVNFVSRDSFESYETTFLKVADEGGEYEQVYFRRLDYEFNKVDKFYRSQVQEVMDDADMLRKQMDALNAFRIKVNKMQGLADRSVEMMSCLASNVATSMAPLSYSSPSGAGPSGIVSMDGKEVWHSRHGQPDESIDDKDDQYTNSINQEIQEEKPKNFIDAIAAPLEILSSVKVNQTLETPFSIIKHCLNVPKQTELNLTRENLKKVEKQLEQAFIEFYYKLRLLKSYSFMNMLAFSKIMKKYDKITSRNASKSYMNMVDNSYLGSSDEVTKLMGRVEATFIKHFSNSNRNKGMNILRPQSKKERH